MTVTLSTSDFETSFWKTFKGKMTLNSLLVHFITKFQYKDTEHIEIFAENIVGSSLIGKRLNKTKLIELVNIEISRFDMNKIQKMDLIPEQQIDHDRVTIYDADKLDGNSFQSFLANVLGTNGYTDVYVTGKSGDQGGDIVASIGDQKFVIQVKRYSIDRQVTNKAVQEVMGAIAFYNCDKGIVATNSYFTSSAKELAKINDVMLWDRMTISKFIENYNNVRKI